MLLTDISHILPIRQLTKDSVNISRNCAENKLKFFFLTRKMTCAMNCNSDVMPLLNLNVSAKTEQKNLLLISHSASNVIQQTNTQKKMTLKTVI